MQCAIALEHGAHAPNPKKPRVVRVTEGKTHMHDSRAAVDDKPVAAVGALHARGDPGRHLRAPLLQLRGAH